ncbi:MAG TPA: glycosyltransferase family 4 protein [Actinopolymorphaceae bacterium]
MHVSDCFLPRLGGIEIQVSELTRMQQEAGHEVIVVTATADREGRVEAPVPVHRLAVNLPWDLPIRPWASRHLTRLFDELQPDVAHVHVGTVSPFAWSAVRQALRRRIPVVVTVHSMWDPFTRMLNRVLDAATRWLSWPIVGTAVSQAAADAIRKVTGDRLPIRVVANGIDAAQWKIARNPSSESESGIVHIVSVGRLALRKRPVPFMKLLRAARARLDPAVRVRATLAGAGPSRGAVERYIGAHDMTSWVHLAGRLDRDQVRELLEDADIFVAPAIQESFGIAALEARTAGIPIVAYAQSGVADFVEHGVEGLLGNTDEEVAAAIARLAGDSDLRTKIAEHNLASEPKHCTWPAVLDGFDDCYAEARARLAEVPADRRF